MKGKQQPSNSGAGGPAKEKTNHGGRNLAVAVSVSLVTWGVYVGLLVFFIRKTISVSRARREAKERNAKPRDIPNPGGWIFAIIFWGSFGLIIAIGVTGGVFQYWSRRR